MKHYKTDIGSHTMADLMSLTGKSRSTVNSMIRSGGSFKPGAQDRPEPLVEFNGVKKTAKAWLKTVENPPLKSEFMIRIRNGWKVDRALTPVVKKTRVQPDGEKLPKEVQAVTDKVEEIFGHNPKLLHAARLQAQGLSNEDIQRRIALL
jgi:hypothetical protein